MHKPLQSRTPAMHGSAPHVMAGVDVMEPRSSGIAFAGILLGYPVAIIAVITLLFAGRPLLETVLVAFGLQVLAFAAVLMIGVARARASDFSVPNDTGLDLAQPEPGEIWRTYSGSNETVEKLRISLISRDMAQSRNIALNLSELGHEVHHSTDCDAMLESVQSRPTDWGLVIFDLDSASDLESGVDELMDFRNGCAGVPVLLLSSDTLRNDLLPHRRSIGDATLRKPVFRTHLLEGMDAAKLNSAAGL